VSGSLDAGTDAGAPDDLRAGLVGTWRLRSWEARGEDGSVELPLGEAPMGILVYTSDSVMITTIGRPDRAPISRGDMLTGPDDERLASMASFIAYSGSFRVEGGDVIHSVEMSLYPNWAGGEQRRHAVLSPDGRELVLSTDSMPVRGRVARHRLTWERRSATGGQAPM
jgi:hypothetical protein